MAIESYSASDGQLVVRVSDPSMMEQVAIKDDLAFALAIMTDLDELAILNLDWTDEETSRTFGFIVRLIARKITKWRNIPEPPSTYQAK